VAILFSIVLLVFALWRSPVLQPKTNTYTSKSSVPTKRVLTNAEALARARSILQLSLSTTTPSANHTTALTQKIINAYIQAKQKGTYNKDAMDTIVSQATKEQFAVRAQPSYTLGDLIEVKDSAKQQRIYKTTLNDVLTPLSTIGEYELTTYGRAVSTQNTADFEKLKNDASLYQNVAINLLAMKVPKGARNAHLAVINSFLSFAQVLNDLNKSETDPMRGLVALRNFMEEEDAIRNAYNQIDMYFILNTYPL